MNAPTTKTCRLPQGPILKHVVRDGTLGAKKRKRPHAGRCLVRVTSYRTHRVDPDNLCAKWFVDSLRYAGIIPDDTEDDIIYQISQEKVKKPEARTEIELSYE